LYFAFVKKRENRKNPGHRFILKLIFCEPLSRVFSLILPPLSLIFPWSHLISLPRAGFLGAYSSPCVSLSLLARTHSHLRPAERSSSTTEPPAAGLGCKSRAPLSSRERKYPAAPGSDFCRRSASNKSIAAQLWAQKSHARCQSSLLRIHGAHPSPSSVLHCAEPSPAAPSLLDRVLPPSVALGSQLLRVSLCSDLDKPRRSLSLPRRRVAARPARSARPWSCPASLLASRILCVARVAFRYSSSAAVKLPVQFASITLSCARTCSQSISSPWHARWIRWNIAWACVRARSTMTSLCLSRRYSPSPSLVRAIKFTRTRSRRRSARQQEIPKIGWRRS
jgi:hypothetical protein